MKRLIHRTRLSIEDVYEMEPIVAMSTINPQMCKQFGIEVEVEQRNEGPIPHLHVYHDRSRNPKRCSYIRLDKAEYSDHHEQPSAPLPKKVKDKFIQIMNSPWPKQLKQLADGTVRPATGYEAAVDTWVDTYEEGDYSKFTQDTEGNLVCPDYSRL